LDFDRFLQSVCPDLDLEWRKFRRRAARHRVERRMKELRLHDYASFLERVKTDPREAEGLADLMRVTVSRFFRDITCWTELAMDVLPVMNAEKTTDRAFRVWSAGCCGGEAPYTLALGGLEYLRPHFPGVTIHVLATDIDNASLERAHKGLYSAGSLREVPAGILDRWFHRRNGMWMIDERVKDMVRFQRRNLMEETPPPGLDLVLCRYLVFTYYGGERLLKASRRLHESLRPGGVLMTGRAEALHGASRILFVPWTGAGCAYRKR